MHSPPNSRNDVRSSATSAEALSPILSRVPAGQTSIWRCPRCHGALACSKATLDCRRCGHAYGQVDGIPDLRVPGESWIDFEEDLATAREVAALDLPLEDLVRAVYARRSGWDEDLIGMRTRQVLAAPERLHGDISGWLAEATSQDVWLDLGCGPGMLLAAAADMKRPGSGIGVDVSMTWLVVARRLILAHGGRPILAAGLGEALPLADGALSGVVSLDVIEHVDRPDAYLREIDRVTRPGGRLALSTPNRFSLAPEPHVMVWGVGLLPHRYQARYVAWRSGKSYVSTCLMSSIGPRRILKRCTNFAARIIIPPVPEDEIRRFSPTKARLARLYNSLSGEVALRAVFLLIGPFFRITGVKETSLPA
ncbi:MULTISPECIES: methyltransferase domain-containing protein [Brevundimonas]|jgi:SAM-dependent methyltransferase|uniref:Methyltransferase domain-containing protein n=2 Tax=Brevundimonas TaxID=41275 RepID=A0ABX7SPL1_9CAUL|nr:MULTISPECIES: methyltransferase domain-containing protein [Brevundimonas]QTC88742.1 methyltransferase domain-containing protein [Brevundimonas pondensis]